MHGSATTPHAPTTSRSTLLRFSFVLTFAGLTCASLLWTQVATTRADTANEAAGRGEQVVLVRSETSPEDVHGMQASQGILTARGGLVSHAAVVARGWGIPAVVGADALRIKGASFTVGDTTVSEGDVISLDGTTGKVVLGEVGLSASEAPPELDVILGWADTVRRAAKTRNGHGKVHRSLRVAGQA